MSIWQHIVSGDLQFMQLPRLGPDVGGVKRLDVLVKLRLGGAEARRRNVNKTEVEFR